MFEREKNRINLLCPILKLLLSILRHVFGDENLEYGILSLWIGSSFLLMSNDGLLFAVFCYIRIFEASVHAPRAHRRTGRGGSPKILGKSDFLSNKRNLGKASF